MVDAASLRRDVSGKSTARRGHARPRRRAPPAERPRPIPPGMNDPSTVPGAAPRRRGRWRTSDRGAIVRLSRSGGEAIVKEDGRSGAAELVGEALRHLAWLADAGVEEV